MSLRRHVRLRKKLDREALVIGSALPCTDQLIALLSPRRQQREPIATPEAYPPDIDQPASPRLIVARLGLFILGWAATVKS